MSPEYPIPRADLPTDTAALARWLIGKRIVRTLPEGVATGRIVETEAYPPGDAAGHAFRGLTPRNRSLFLEPGHAYVYQAYGTAWMLNVSSEPAGVGAGVLIRALEPLEGLEIMRANRGPKTPPRDFARGPGRLSAALAIDRALDGADLCRPGPLWLAPDDQHADPADIGQSVRIGLTREVGRPWRFYLRHSPFLSGPKALSP